MDRTAYPIRKAILTTPASRSGARFSRYTASMRLFSRTCSSLLTVAGVLAAAPTPHPALAAAPAAAPARKVLVVCAPGYPGSTSEAQPTMDVFAAAAAQAAGWKTDQLGAVYYESFETGVAALKEEDAALALVTLPVFLEEETGLGLKPRLQAVPVGGAAAETWSLAARKGAVHGPADLDGWQIVGGAGDSATFVRGPALGAWGALPASTRILFAPAPLLALRRAAAGEKVAVLLDSEGAKALPTLPFAGDLEIVTTSPAWPGSLLCTVGDRLPPKEADRFLKGLGRLPQIPAGPAALQAIRLQRFETPDAGALDKARQAFAQAAKTAPAGKPPGSSR
jgi:hypothetical protein